MGLRFRRSVRIMPGVSLNISKSGLGISAGPRGMKFGVGPRGVHRSVGLPGTGLHFREEKTWGGLKKQAAANAGRATSTEARSAHVRLHDDGTVDIVGTDGSSLPARVQKAFRDQNAAQIEAFLVQESERWNDGIDQILDIHLRTPDPVTGPTFYAEPFATDEPIPLRPKNVGVFGRIWPPYRRRIEEQNRARQQSWEKRLLEWREAKQAHEEGESARHRSFELAQQGNVEAMEAMLTTRLCSLDWPRETEVAFQISDNGKIVGLDVDLPEVEDMPSEEAKPAARGLKLNIRQKSDTQVRREYMRHIHAVLFRLAGEVFHTFPRVGEVVASGYSQRTDPATGNVRDDYLLSARIPRDRWEEISFSNLDGLDVVAAFERFDLVRTMTKTGIFRPVEPHPFESS